MYLMKYVILLEIRKSVLTQNFIHFIPLFLFWIDSLWSEFLIQVISSHPKIYCKFYTLVLSNCYIIFIAVCSQIWTGTGSRMLGLDWGRCGEKYRISWGQWNPGSKWFRGYTEKWAFTLRVSKIYWSEINEQLCQESGQVP